VNAPVVVGLLHWLPWTQTWPASALFAVCALIALRQRHPSAGVFRELALIVGLYSLWSFAGMHANLQIGGAIERGRWVWRVEQWLPLPSELTVQHVALHAVWFVKLLNVYYASAHFPSIAIFLVWLFWRHRDQYPRIRNTIAMLTGACLAIQLIPVSPPRLTPGLGFIDTPLRYGPSVYPPLGHSGPDQFSAMPSLHIGWASVIAISVILVSQSRWRWLVLAHFFGTFTAVVATGNHWYLDGFVAMAILAVCFGIEAAVRGAINRLRASFATELERLPERVA
jgi:hypothetical protein